MSSSKKHRAKVLGVLVCLVLIDKVESPAARSAVQKLQGPINFERQSDRGGPGRDAVDGLETKMSTTSIKRRLLQRRRQSRARVQSGCELSSEDVDRFYDASSQQWLINDAVLEELDNDVQAIVECAYENDTLLFAIDQIIKPRKTLVLSHNLTIASRSESGSARSGVRVSVSGWVRMTCPDSGQLILSKSPSFTLKNVVIEDCNTTLSVVETDLACNNEGLTGIVRFHGLIIERNMMHGQGSILNSSNARCSQLELNSVSIRLNRCVGPCVVLSSSNRLNNVALASNQRSNNNSEDSSIFASAHSSDIVAQNVTSENNKIRSFQVTNSTLRITNSYFHDNRRRQSSWTRDRSIGGGVLFSNHSSISISNTTFERNVAFNGGVLFAWTSNMTITNCIFRANEAGGGDGGALYGHYNSSFDISSSVFSKNRGHRGSGVYSKYTRRVDMTNVSVWENNCSMSCGIWIINGNATIESSEFLRNSADRAGAALCTSTSNLSLENSAFIGNSARFGGACSFEYNSTINASNLSFENNTARNTYGGAIYFYSGRHLTVRDSIFQKNNAVLGGGAVRAWGEGETVVKRVVFLNNTSGDYGGAIRVQKGNFTGSNMTFGRNSASRFGGAISFQEANSVSVSQSHFEDNQANNAGAIMFLSTTSGSIDQCTFVRNVRRVQFGGAINMAISNVNISSSLFRSNSAFFGGSLVLAERCSSTVLNSTFENNSAYGTGSAIMMSLRSSLLLVNSSFSGGRARLGGALAVDEYSNASLSRVRFWGNYAYSGGCLYLSNFGRVLVLDSLFSNNTARHGGGAIDLHDNSELLMSKSSLVGNSGRSIGGGIEVSSNSTAELNTVSFCRNKAGWGGAVHLSESGNATISNCSFSNNTAFNNGGAVLLCCNSTASLTSSTFQGNQASFGGGLYIWNNSTALVSLSKFAKNSASTSGGGIYLHRSDMCLSSTQLYLNSATYGGSLYCSNASFEATNSTIYRSHAWRHGGAVYMRATNASLDTTRLESNEAIETGGGVALINASSLMCLSCLILNNRALSGAGLYAFSNNSIPIVAQFQSSRFENNSAESYGGGIAFAGVQNKTINCNSPNATCGYIVLLNTSFIGNYANYSGAIVLTIDANRVLVDCEYKGEDRRNQVFLNRTEMNSLEVLDPIRLCTSWVRNKVANTAHGNVVGTYGQEIVLSIDPGYKVRLLGSIANGYVLENVQSGRELPTINVTILDGYGASPALTLPYSFEARISSPDDFFVGLHSTEMVGGFGSFSRVSGFVAPGNYTFKFDFDNEALEGFNVTVMVRECIVGEEPTRDGLTCQECDAFSYNFNASQVGGCKGCPDDATCEGRYIVPNEGHWHKSPCHDTVKECLVEEACAYEKRQEVIANFTQSSTDCNINETTIKSYNDALCNEGYKGPLCGSCKKSFGLSVRFLCLRCASSLISLLAIVGITLYLLGASTLTIRGCLPSNLQPHDYQPGPSQSTSASESSYRDPEVNVEMVKMMVEGHVPREYIEQRRHAHIARTETGSNQQETERELTRWRTTEIFKIMLNFLQTIAVAATISVKWTRGMLTLFEASEYLGALTTVAVSRPVDCITSSTSAITKAVWRMLVSLFVPGAVVSILVSVWGYIAFKEKKGWSYFWKRFTLSVIAVTYISYLGLTKMAIRAFYCVGVYDSNNPLSSSKEKFWAIDTAVKCYGKDHSGIIAIAVLVIFVITVCFPLISAIILSHNKEGHKKRDSWVFETAGFLFRVFKEKLAFWESVVMFRKACLSVIVVFSYPLGGEIQGILASVLLLFCLYLHLTLRPYRQEFETLNHVESSSLLMASVTFNLSLIFVSDRCSDLVRTLVAAGIVLGDCMFFAFLLLAFFRSVVSHLRVALKCDNMPLPDNAPWWRVLKVYIKSRSCGGSHHKT